MIRAGERFARWALAALLLTAPAVAAPVQPPAPRIADPSAHALFEALRLRPATSDAQIGLPPEQTARMDAFVASIFTRGEAVANWQNEGLSQRALLAARPGGAAAQMFEGALSTGPYRIYPGDAPIASLIPARWVPVAHYGARREDGEIRIEIARISAKIVGVARIGVEEVGNATCHLHAYTVFYADPAVPASQSDVIALGIHLRALLENNRQMLCTFWEERAPGAYRPRFFDRSGRRIPQLDAQTRTFRIVPRAPFSQAWAAGLSRLASSPDAPSTFFDAANTTPAPEGVGEARPLFDALAGEPLDEARPARSFPVRFVLYEDLARTFARGERVAGWQARGVDLRAILAGRPGGLAGNYATARGPTYSRHISFHDAPIESWAPPGWRLVARRGATVEAADVRVEITLLTPMLMLVERVAYRREGQAWCRVRADSRIFADPAGAAAYRDVGVFVNAYGALGFLDRAHLCVVMEEEAPGLYRARHFDREGHRLPVLDSPEEVIQPVPLPPNLYRIVARPPGR